MNRSRQTPQPRTGRIPRASGDEPIVKAGGGELKGYSPRERG